MVVREHDEIFTTGAFLRPVKFIIHGTEQWCWVVVRFEDDSYFDGKLVEPFEYANRIENMINSRNCEK